jgi:hypothetical protein
MPDSLRRVSGSERRADLQRTERRYACGIVMDRRLIHRLGSGRREGSALKLVYCSSDARSTPVRPISVLVSQVNFGEIGATPRRQRHAVDCWIADSDTGPRGWPA